MNTHFGWTTLEQSKKLVEAGLDPNTADMHYCFEEGEGLEEYDIDEITREHCILDVKGEYAYDEEYMKKHMIPCWSLGRLIELMPKSLQIEGSPSFEIEGHSNEMHYIYYEEAYGVFFPHVIHKECKTTIFESIYSMVIWLLENNYINKGETK